MSGNGINISDCDNNDCSHKNLHAHIPWVQT